MFHLLYFKIYASKATHVNVKSHILLLQRERRITNRQNKADLQKTAETYVMQISTKKTINHFCLNNLYQTAGLEGIPLSYDFLQRRKNPMVCHARPEEAEQPAACLQGAWRKGN